MYFKRPILGILIFLTSTSCGGKTKINVNVLEPICPGQCSLCLKTEKDGPILERALKALLEESERNPSSICGSELSFVGLEKIYLVLPERGLFKVKEKTNYIVTSNYKEAKKFAQSTPDKAGFLKFKFFDEENRKSLFCHYNVYKSKGSGSLDAGKVTYSVSAIGSMGICLVEEYRIVH